MEAILTQLIILLVLLSANGLFAMAEISVVSSRKARLSSLAAQGHKGAKAALVLSGEPADFLSTVQIGITLIGIFAGAFGGATLAAPLAKTLEPLPWIGPYSPQIAFGIVVLLITYASLVIGELVPKRYALQNPEGIAALVALPMQVLARLASPVVRLLSGSTSGMLRLLGVRETSGNAVTEEEVAGVVREGLAAGALHPVESEMVHSVLALDRLSVRQIMTHKPRIVWLDAQETDEQTWHKIVASHHSQFPVTDGSRDALLGMLSVKSIYANLAAGAPVDIRNLVTPALIVPETQSAITLLETFKRDRRHVALATNEYGEISGLVTTNDILQAIVGKMPEADQTRSEPFVRRQDGSVLVDALVGIEEVESYFEGFDLLPEEERLASTLGGYICERIGHIPKEGEYIEEAGYRFEVVDMDRLRVDKVLVTRVAEPFTRPDVEVP